MNCRNKPWMVVVLLFVAFIAGGSIYSLSRNYQLEKIGRNLNVRFDKDSQQSSEHTQEKIDKIPPCGDVCNYAIKQTFPGELWPRLQKQINCDDIIGRMAWRQYVIKYPPPKSPPIDQIKEFQQNGECPFGKEWYFNEGGPSRVGPSKHSRGEIDSKMAQDRAGKNIGYPDSFVMSKMIKDYQKWIHGKRGFVVGTVDPWLEAMLLNSNASQVTTLEYNTFTVDHPQIDVIDPYSFAEKYLNGEITKYDFGATYSSMEHSGLGRYGDPLNPYGDLEAMAQSWCMTKPGGLFLLGLPGGYSKDAKCLIRFNAGRWYSPGRLQHLAANWDVLGARHSGTEGFVLALKKMD